jgi:hypothetical protein
VHDHQRYVLALRFVEKGESMETLVAWLLSRLKSMGISIRYAYLDKGFCSVPVLKTLERRKISFILPIPVRGKSGGVRKLFEASARGKTIYTFNSPKRGKLEVAAVVVKNTPKDVTNGRLRAGLLMPWGDCPNPSSRTRFLRCIVNDLGLKRVIVR